MCHAIRDFVDRNGTPGIAVCSRIQEYEALPDRLKLAGAITLPRTRKKQRDPEMHQTKKGNQWFFGMKAHIGVDIRTKLICQA